MHCVYSSTRTRTRTQLHTRAHNACTVHVQYVHVQSCRRVPYVAEYENIFEDRQNAEVYFRKYGSALESTSGSTSVCSFFVELHTMVPSKVILSYESTKVHIYLRTYCTRTAVYGSTFVLYNVLQECSYNIKVVRKYTTSRTVHVQHTNINTSGSTLCSVQLCTLWATCTV